MTQLHETLIGKRLLEGTLPKIERHLERIAQALEKLAPETTEATDKSTLIGTVDINMYPWYKTTTEGAEDENK